MARREISEDTIKAVVAAYNNNLPIPEIQRTLGVSASSIYRWTADPRYNEDGNEKIELRPIDPRGPRPDNHDSPNPNDEADFQVVLNLRGKYLRYIVSNANFTIVEITRRPKDAV